ncbi:hypothetical protein EV182_001034 [Spiromyces aspiralis]|uniref:Uncharacterized protein n=1 Tax=Spiromyces aspiralis TaxID=68401 RepID=A0ACC1HXT0_9FUNG|nr:hypothetical protein EV182_001034 [Spiromyces aspiralis]
MPMLYLKDPTSGSRYRYRQYSTKNEQSNRVLEDFVVSGKFRAFFRTKKRRADFEGATAGANQAIKTERAHRFNPVGEYRGTLEERKKREIFKALEQIITRDDLPSQYLSSIYWRPVEVTIDDPNITHTTVWYKVTSQDERIKPKLIKLIIHESSKYLEEMVRLRVLSPNRRRHKIHLRFKLVDRRAEDLLQEIEKQLARAGEHVLGSQDVEFSKSARKDDDRTDKE